MAEEKILDRVAKLLALAERAGTEHEADAAYAKATELMTRHAIEQWQLAGRGEAKREQVVTRSARIKDRHDRSPAQRGLITQIARANRCEAVWMRGLDMMAIYGFESDAEFVKTLYGLVLVQMSHAAAKAWRGYTIAAGGSKSWQIGTSRHLYIKSFEFAFATRVGERLTEAATREEVKHAGAELALIDRSALVRQAMPETRATTTRIQFGGGEGAGRDAGDRADLSGGRHNVGADSRPRLA